MSCHVRCVFVPGSNKFQFRSKHPLCPQLSVADDEVEPSRHLPRLVQDMNSNLPSDVRVLSAVRCAKGTVARHGLAGREYVYFMPLAALVRDPQLVQQLSAAHTTADAVFQHPAVQRALAQLSHCTQLMCGSHPWHNFTRHKQRNTLARYVFQ